MLVKISEYSPDKQEQEFENILKQAELFANEWAG